ncbi:MAG: hypothetical protein ACP5JP_09510 [bacterium]
MAVTPSSWAQNAAQAGINVPTLSEQVRLQATPQMLVRELARPEPGYGKHDGDTIRIVKVMRPTPAGGQISELSIVPLAKLSYGYVDTTVKAYGNKIASTETWDQLMQVLDIKSKETQALKDDMALTLNAYAAQALVNNVDCWFDRSGGANDGTVIGGNTNYTVPTRKLTAQDLRNIMKFLKSSRGKNPSPYYTKTSYLLIGDPFLIGGLLDDTSAGGFIDTAKYTNPEAIYENEVGKLWGFRLIEENHWFNAADGGNSSYGRGAILAYDALIEAVALEPEIRYNPPRDLFREFEVGWVFLGAWNRVWDYANDLSPRVVYIP